MSSEIYREVIDSTLLTVRERARSFRNLVVCVVLLVVACLVLSLAWRMAAGAVCLLLLVPLAGSFMWLDACTLARWRRPVVERWIAGQLDVGALAAALLAVPGLPGPTIEAMLSTLPGQVAHEAPPVATQSTRVDIAATLEGAHRANMSMIKLRTVASLVVGLLLIAWVWAR